MAEKNEKPLFWSDQLAFGVTRKFPDRDTYVCASGISPSGLVHAGNFREIITTDFVVKSLQYYDEDTRFIYSWDDYDRFRKVPENVPDEWEQYIGLPLSEVPDPEECHESYAEHFEAMLEEELEDMHMDIEFIRQSEMFRSCEYAELMKQAMNSREEIKDILDEYRTEPLEDDWWPLRVYCRECGKDFTEIQGYDGDYTVEYFCKECGEEFEVDFSEEDSVKPPWRVDWPMRWKYENVAFEPGGKDHSAAGSSRDTGKDIVEEVFDHEAPVYQMYDFIKPKGGDKKISSSSGENALTLSDLKEVYTPEMIRFLFSETKPNKEFAIPFDEDVFQRYDKFDTIESAYFNPEEVENDRKRKHWKRVYELAMVEIPDEQPVRFPFQHAAFIAQTVPEEEWAEKAVKSLQRTGHVPGDVGEKGVEQVVERLEKAKNWARNYAPEEYRYSINRRVPAEEVEQLSEDEQEAMLKLAELLESREFETVDELDGEIFEVQKQTALDTGEFFDAAYRVMLSRDHGPRLSRLFMSLGQEETARILRQVE
ncbi:MAG: lysine--tRNA ligase [Candidatus Nanohaloarchaea archaeon]